MKGEGWKKEIALIHQRRKAAKKMGGAEAVRAHRAKGRLTIRERVEALLDGDSFREMGEMAGAALYDEAGREIGFQPGNFVLGFGEIEGRAVLVGGEDFTLKGGSPNAAGLRKSVHAEDLALQYRIPLIRLHEGGGGSVAGAAGAGGEKSKRARAYSGGAVFERHRFLSVARTLGEVPVASAALGAVAGLPAARLVSSHFTVMTRNAQVLIAGPKIVERALSRKATKEELGGWEVHLRSGVIDNLAEDERDAMGQIRRFLSYLPQNARQYPPSVPSRDRRDRMDAALSSIVPRERRKPYRMRDILEAVLDRDSFFEMTPLYGRSMITALGRLDGEAVGVVANDCMVYAGATTAASARKFRRFLDMCNVFHLPILSFVDEPGFMIGLEAERSGAIREGMAAMAAVMQTRVPWASVIVRKVFGVAGGLHMAPGAFIVSWPSAETGAVPVEGGVAVAFARQIAAASDPEAMRRELEERIGRAMSAFPRAEAYAVHDLIDPRETRPRLVDWLRLSLSAFRADSAGLYRHGIRP